MSRGIVVGVVVWALVTLIMRLWSGVLLPRSSFEFLKAFLLAVPVAGSLAIVLRLFVCPRGEVERFALGLAVPGLLLGAATLFAFGDVFPDATPLARGHYGTLMLWGYGLILAIFLLSVEGPKR